MADFYKVHRSRINEAFAQTRIRQYFQVALLEPAFFSFGKVPCDAVVQVVTFQRVNDSKYKLANHSEQVVKDWQERHRLRQDAAFT